MPTNTKAQESQIVQLNKRSQELKSQYNYLESENVQINKRMQELKSQYNSLQSQSAQINNRMQASGNTAVLQSQLAQINKRMQELNSQYNDLNSQSIQINKRTQALKTQYNVLDSQVEQLNKRQAERTSSKTIQSESVQTNKKQEKKKYTNNDLRSQLANLDKRMQELKSQYNFLQSQSAQINKRMQASGNTAVLQSQLANLDKRMQEVKSQYNRLDSLSVQTNKKLQSLYKPIESKASIAQQAKRDDLRGYSHGRSSSDRFGNASYTGDKVQNKVFGDHLSKIEDVLWANTIYNRQDIQWYRKFNRFGALDPYNALSGTKEYIFFTKPDLHIVTPKGTKLNPELNNQPFFVELRNRYPDVITQLQSSNGFQNGNYNPFMAILSNSVKNSLEIPSVSANTVDTPATIYGTAYNYRGWGFSSDEKIEFSLEFEDSKYLEIYNLVKAYEEYERLKHIGLVTPPNITGGFNYYIKNKILHDQFSIYKFIVEDDGETILYYAKLWGVFFKNVPRDSFSDMKVEGGLTYAVDFEAAFIDDMNPTILTDFNQVISPYVNKYKNDLPIYNIDKRMIDGKWANLPIVTKVSNKGRTAWNGPNNMSYVYKLKWRV